VETTVNSEETKDCSTSWTGKYSGSIAQERLSEMGYIVESTTIYALQFAEDQVVMAQSKEDLKYMCRKLKKKIS
jgi:hypothetical protein